MKPEIKVQIKLNKNLSSKEKKFINDSRIADFGKNQVKDFSKDYEPNTIWFFVIRGNKIVSFGGIRPIKVDYLGKAYRIGGICSTISLEKMKGYGRIMVGAMIKYSKKTGKTILGFTGKTKFFAKVGLGTKKNFIRRFIWVKPDGNKGYDSEGEGRYDEGKDKLISNVLKGRSQVYIYVEHW